ncbi:hypothetical protein DFH28DRAFT_1060558 [Melampsora americana]|nr:hypothetical protein DFH28DRAFT_1060558 [Melampsora americana]
MKKLAAFRSSKASYGLDEQEHEISTLIEPEEHTSKDDGAGCNIYESEGFIRSFYRVTFSLLVKTLAPFLDFFFFPMPTKNVPNYFLKAINPYQPVPYPNPPVTDGKETGLVCKSKACRTRPTHSTVYFPSKHRHLTGIKCPFDKGFFRTYNSDHFINQLREINIRRDNVQSLEISDREAAMELHRMLNGPLTPPPTQENTRIEPVGNPPEQRERNPGECIGIKGHYAGGHQLRKNAGCTANACKACCLNLNLEFPCQAHSKMARRKTKEDVQRGRVPMTPLQSTQPKSNVINLMSSSIADSNDSDGSLVRSTQGGRSHGVRMYKGRLQTDFLDEYRTMTLKREAAERKRATNADTASKTVALVIWPGSKDEPLASWGGMVHASTWPQFALSESTDVKALVAKELGGDWTGNLQVWNEENQLWIHTAIDIIVTYPENTRKVLIVFPGIKPSECNDVERHLASVSMGGKKDSMNLTAFIQRNSSVTPQKKNNTKFKVNVIDLQSPSSTPERENSQANGPREQEFIDLDSDLPPLPVTPSTVATRNKRPRSPDLPPCNIEEIPDIELSDGVDQSTPVRGKNQRGPRWSKSATMLEMQELYHLTQAPRKLQYQDAYVAVFGTRFRYVPSTISHYCRWCEAITPKRLDPFVKSNSTMTVEEARTYHFQLEWRSTDHNRFEKYAKAGAEKPRAKRVKL